MTLQNMQLFVFEHNTMTVRCDTGNIVAFGYAPVPYLDSTRPAKTLVASQAPPDGPPSCGSNT